MSKKKNKAGKKKSSLLSGAAKSIRKLTTTQKVVGGSALLALGLGYLAQRQGLFASASADTDPDTGASLTSSQGASL
ncbi:hypothetical protein F0P96_09760 [Hymenobacter busanensis]|uniref:Uncharacterized protein n=1 Tax=Hymenobacter busanensis TaxID=2607656 RepID=A0A7L4ZX35_9BACT|nr:hypothetical protein [Hymenobacter busanensis]KAA9333254.1 hypothetical protein F0P96_09760 [Hymenobacter busanensis]QHJ08069.1 hypothetical protein GUY19_12560 [Hymenobacter busanensis]